MKNYPKSATTNRSKTTTRSSGYLPTKFKFRLPPSPMAWLDDDTDLDGIDGSNRPPSPEPQLEDFIQQVLQRKRTAITQTKEKAYKTAHYLAVNVVEAAFDCDGLFSKYIRQQDLRPEICDFRAVDKNVYVGLVPLRKPVRVNTFTMLYTSRGDLPVHRILVQVNQNLTKEEKANVINDWGHCLDGQGYFRPEFVLLWFNRGLFKACANIEIENKRTQTFSNLETSLTEDGTLWIHVIDAEPQNSYKINLIPCIPISEVPKQMNLTAPIPSRRPFNASQSKFLQDINQRIHNGEEILFLEAKLEKWSREKRCRQSLEITWGMNIGQIEDRAFACLNAMKPAKIFEDLIVLINALKEGHAFCLHSVTNRVINHAIFYNYKKGLGKYTQRQEWLLGVLETIKTHLESRFFPNFFLPKQNILMETDTKTLDFNKEELVRMIKDIKSYPEFLLTFAGCEDETNKENESGDSSSEHDETDTPSDSLTSKDDPEND